MGIQSHMRRSVAIAANFMFKLHVAAIDCARPEVTLYPVMDGFYATCVSREPLQAFLTDIFRSLAQLFANEGKLQFRFVIRGAVAFGPICHGRDIDASASWQLSANPVHRDALFIGVPIVDAHEGEQYAPPFGLHVHQSARAEWDVVGDWWRWFENMTAAAGFARLLSDYYDWCAANSATTGYRADRVEAHRAAALQYLGAS